MSPAHNNGNRHCNGGTRHAEKK